MKKETFWKLCKWNDDKRNMEARRLQEATCLVYRIFYFFIQLNPWYGRNGVLFNFHFYFGIFRKKVLLKQVKECEDVSDLLL